MGLLKKVKDILFDEEDDFTEQIKITPEMRNEESERKTEISIKEPKKEEQKIERAYEETKPHQSERDLFQNESTFPFFDDFDEKEFDRINQNTPEPIKPVQKTNSFNYERPHKPERRNDYSSYSKSEMSEVVTEKKKFKPSPIISPVFGVLDKDYSKDDIIPNITNDKLNIEKVRDKAFGEKKESEKVISFEEEKTVTIPKIEETKKKVKTIDELLEDTSDIVVNIDKDLETEVESILPDEPPIEKYKPKTAIKEEKIDEVLEDTLESDLFDLIDQMYDNKEEGDE